MGRPAVAAAVAVLTLGSVLLVTGEPAASAERNSPRKSSRDSARESRRDSGQERSDRRFRNEQGADTGQPAQFVAERDGRIVVVSATTGRVERYLTARSAGGATDPALSPDGRTIWFSRSDGACAAHLASIPLAGGKEEKLAGSGEAGPETRPLPRPDRAHIAYGRNDCKDPSAAALIVGDLAGLEGHGQLGLAPLAWSRDGGLLLASAVGGSDVRLLEVSKSGAIVGNQPLAVGDNSTECRLQVIGFSPDDNNGYVALRRCGSGESARRTLVLLDRDGRYRQTVVRLPRGEDFLDRPAFDSTGHSLLYATAPTRADQRSGTRDPGVTLRLWRDGETRTLARQSGYHHPSWLP